MLAIAATLGRPLCPFPRPAPGSRRLFLTFTCILPIFGVGADEQQDRLRLELIFASGESLSGGALPSG
eukprot:1144673-Pelagomonas_calceolata.AAC.1